MKYYRGEAVLKQAEARLFASGYPDCVCVLQMTDDTFFVLEDNFDNTYTEHFIIPLSHIHLMEKTVFTYEMTYGGAAKSSTWKHLATEVFTTIASLAPIAGGIVLPRQQSYYESTEYLKIVYSGEYGQDSEILLGGSDKKIYNFIKIFNKKQETIL